MMYPWIYDRVAICGASLHKLATSQMTKVIKDAARSSAQVLRTPRCVIQMGRDDCNISVSSPWANYPVMIGVIGVPPTRYHSGSLQVFNKWQSTVSGKIGDTQKLDPSVDRKFAYYGDSTSIFNKLIGLELSHSYIADLYLRCWVDFASNAVRTEAPHFVDLGILAVNV